MGREDTVPPPRPDAKTLARLKIKSQPIIEQHAPRKVQEGYDDAALARELERLERERVLALSAAQDATRAAEAARDAALKTAAEAPSKEQWARLAFKLVGAIAGLVVAASVALGAWSSAQGARIDRTQERQQTQDNATGTVVARVKALEDYTAALKAHSDCVDAERDSAIERGTGHVVEGEHSKVIWAEENLPKPKPRNLWPAPVWLITVSRECPRAPEPPKAPIK
jgi:hypothetical protein